MTDCNNTTEDDDEEINKILTTWEMAKMTTGQTITAKSSSGRIKSSSSKSYAAEQAEKLFKEALSAYDIKQLLNVACGLPGRIRQHIKKVRKLQKKFNGDWVKVAAETAEESRKIIQHKLDVYIFFPLISMRTPLTPEQVDLFTKRLTESDMLLVLYAAYFVNFASPEPYLIYNNLIKSNTRKCLGGLVDVMEFGSLSDRIKRIRKTVALTYLKEQNYELMEETEE